MAREVTGEVAGGAVRGPRILYVPYLGSRGQTNVIFAPGLGASSRFANVDRELLFESINLSYTLYR